MFDAEAGLHNPLRFALLLHNPFSVMTWGVVFLAAFVLIALGIIGAIKPTLGSLLHNGTTIALSALNTRRYLPKETKRVDIDHPIA